MVACKRTPVNKTRGPISAAERKVDELPTPAAEVRRRPNRSEAVLQLPETGYLRLKQIIGNRKAGIEPIFPVGKSTWWAGVKAGRFPAPTRALGTRITAWRVEDIRKLIEDTAP